MYGASSPIFDTPELPSLRRMKPLPKRRRTSDTASHEDAINDVGLPDLLPSDGAPDASTQGFEDALAAQLTLPSYYNSLLSGVKDLLKQGMDGRPPASHDLKDAGLSGGRGGRGFEDDGGEGDYVDHLQQPGNTKKRKVPANLAAAAHGQDGSGQSGGEDEPTDRAIPTGRPESEYDNAPPRTQASLQGSLARRKGKLTKAMIAGIQHKEMLKNRKRQLAAVLGALTQGDTLALDQALSAHYPFTGGLAGDQEPPGVRLSRRRPAILARAFKTFQSMFPEPESTVAFPQSEFTFVCASTTSDRLRDTKKEVAALHARFEAELKRQAARAAEVARQTSAVLTGSTPVARKTKQGRTSGGGKEPKTTNVEQSLLGTPTKGKKKKRSARANASNPHHLRNYVPSRLPHSGQANATSLSLQNLLSPLPVRFLSTDIPPRRQKKSAVPVSSLNNPTEEWICPFCEYDLFYGSDDDYRRAVNNRKKILKRRRRARERAAAAASGANAAVSKTTSTSEDVDGDADAEFEAPYLPEPINGTGKQRPSRSRPDDRSGANTVHTTPHTTPG